MIKENSNGVMEAFSKVTSRKIILKVLENTSGPMAESSMVSG